MEIPFMPQRRPDLSADVLDMSQVHMAVALARCAYGNKRDVRFGHSSIGIGGRPQPPATLGFGDEFLDTWFHNRAMAAIQCLGFERISINSDNVVAAFCQTSG